MVDKALPGQPRNLKNVCFRLVQDTYTEHRWICLGGLGGVMLTDLDCVSDDNARLFTTLPTQKLSNSPTAARGGNRCPYFTKEETGSQESYLRTQWQGEVSGFESG